MVLKITYAFQSSRFEKILRRNKVQDITENIPEEGLIPFIVAEKLETKTL